MRHTYGHCVRTERTRRALLVVVVSRAFMLVPLAHRYRFSFLPFSNSSRFSFLR